MDAYLALADEEGGRVPLTGPVAVYRDPDGSQEVRIATEERDLSLGVSDATVSRAKDGTPPITFEPVSGGVEVRNGGNANALTVRTGDGERSVREGRVARVERDARVDVGYNTTLKLTIERREGDVVHEGQGDIVLGGKTAVEDSVVNRSNIDGDG